MNHTLAELPFAAQGVLIFFNWIACVATFCTVAYYTLVVKSVPKIECCTTKKIKPDDDDDEDEKTYRERVEREINVERAQLRENVKVETEFRDLLGIEELSK